MLVSRRRFVWGRHPDFLPMESSDDCTLVLPSRAGVRVVLRQILHPLFANTLSVLAAFPASIRFSSCWPRGLTTRVGRDEAPLLWRTSGDNRLLSVGGPNVCSAEGLPRFAKRFHDNSRVDCLLKGIESTALPITLTRETRDVVLYWTLSYTYV